MTATVELRAMALAGALIAACAAHAQPGRDVVRTPDVIWRDDGRELPPNSFGKVRNAFSPDGRLIGVVEQPDKVWLLNAGDGSLFYTLPYSSSSWGAYSIAFSPNGGFALGRLKTVEIFDARGRSLRSFECMCSVVDAVAFSADGTLLAFQETRGPDFPGEPQTTVVDTSSYRFIRSVGAASNRPQIAFAPNGKQFLASAFSRVDGRWALGFETWDTSSWTPSLEYHGVPRSGTDLGFVATGSVDGHEFVAVYGRNDSLEMRDVTSDRVLWSVPLLPPMFAPPETQVFGTASEFERGAIAPNGKFVITYEAPVALPIGRSSGGIVVRSAGDGSVIAVYAVYGVTGLSIAPDSKTFVYSTGAGKMHTALVRVPKEASP